MRKLLAILGLTAAFVVTATPRASAGGWATASLDPVPALVAGQEVEIGFTIRQHGVTPVDYDIGTVAVVVRSPSGGEERFGAHRDGPAGHFVADVVFPEAGESTWAIDQGMFGEYALGRLDVAAAGPEAAGAETAATSVGAPAPSELRWPLAVRLGLPVIVVGSLALVVADLRRHRRAVRWSRAPLTERQERAR